MVHAFSTTLTVSLSVVFKQTPCERMLTRTYMYIHAHIHCRSVCMQMMSAKSCRKSDKIVWAGRAFNHAVIHKCTLINTPT